MSLIALLVRCLVALSASVASLWVAPGIGTWLVVGTLMVLCLGLVATLLDRWLQAMVRRQPPRDGPQAPV